MPATISPKVLNAAEVTTATVKSEKDSAIQKMEKQANDATMLFIRSLKNTNPMQKSDPSEITKNALAILGMQQTADTQRHLYNMSEAFTGVQLNAALPGKSMLIPGDSVEIAANGQAVLEYKLPNTIKDKVSLEIIDQNGKVVHTADVLPGSTRFIWNATNIAAGDAGLKFRIVAKDDLDKNKKDLATSKGTFATIEYVSSEMDPNGKRVTFLETKSGRVALQDQDTWAIKAAPQNAFGMYGALGKDIQNLLHQTRTDKGAMKVNIADILTANQLQAEDNREEEDV